MSNVNRTLAEFLLRPSAAAGDKLMSVILSAPSVVSEEEQARKDQLRRERLALNEAHERAHLDQMRALHARTLPTFEKHLEEARRQHGLA